TQGASIGATAPGGVPLIVRDCEGVTPAPLTGGAGFPPNTPYLADANVTIIQLADGRSHYIPGRISRASMGDYLADNCPETTPYTLPADFLSGPGNVWVLFTPVLAEQVRKYLQLQLPFAGQVVPGPGI